MIRHETWERFGELLEVRLARAVFTTEDSVRFTFLAALLEQQQLRPEDIVLEHRHPAIVGAEVDTYVPTLGVAAEFKYDRDIPSGRNTPRTQKAGKVFHDLCRLGQLTTTQHRHFVYLASSDMTSYFSNPRNGLTDFFSLTAERSLRIDAAFVSGRSETFVACLGATPNFEVAGLYARDLPDGHQLRAYEIREAALG